MENRISLPELFWRMSLKLEEKEMALYESGELDEVKDNFSTGLSPYFFLDYFNNVVNYENYNITTVDKYNSLLLELGNELVEREFTKSYSRYKRNKELSE